MGVQPPDIQSGPVPDWVAEGIRLSRKRGRMVLRVSPAFDVLSPAEQEAALASMLVASDLARRGRLWFWAVFAPTLLVVGFAYGIASGLLGFPDWMLYLGAFAIYVIIASVVYTIWLRRITYQHDRALTKLMGRPVVDLLLDLDARKRPELRGFPLVYITLAAPHETRRVERLDTPVAQH